MNAIEVEQVCGLAAQLLHENQGNRLTPALMRGVVQLLHENLSRLVVDQAAAAADSAPGEPT